MKKILLSLLLTLGLCFPAVAQYGLGNYPLNPGAIQMGALGFWAIRSPRNPSSLPWPITDRRSRMLLFCLSAW